MSDQGDFHGYRAGTGGWQLRDSHLTGWATDADGNLVCTGTGQLLAGAGTQEAPAYAFAAFPGTGIRSDDGGNLLGSVAAQPGFWHGWDPDEAVARFECDVLDAYVRFETNGGNATAPTVRLGGSGVSPTGLYGEFGGSGVSVTVHGTQRWTFDGDGKLTPALANQVPATPTNQQIVDVLKSLGILTQAA